MPVTCPPILCPLNSSWKNAQDLIGKLEEKRKMRRPSSRWEGNIKLDRKHVKWKIVDRIDINKDEDGWWAILIMVMGPRFSQKTETYLTSWTTVSFSRRTLLYGVGY
jgi:hypothetical protein